MHETRQRLQEVAEAKRQEQTDYPDRLKKFSSDIRWYDLSIAATWVAGVAMKNNMEVDATINTNFTQTGSSRSVELEGWKIQNWADQMSLVPWAEPENASSKTRGIILTTKGRLFRFVAPDPESPLEIALYCDNSERRERGNCYEITPGKGNRVDDLYDVLALFVDEKGLEL